MLLYDLQYDWILFVQVVNYGTSDTTYDTTYSNSYQVQTPQPSTYTHTQGYRYQPYWEIPRNIVSFHYKLSQVSGLKNERFMGTYERVTLSITVGVNFCLFWKLNLWFKKYFKNLMISYKSLKMLFWDLHMHHDKNFLKPGKFCGLYAIEGI